MKYTVYSICLLLFCSYSFAQFKVEGRIQLDDPSIQDASIKIYDKSSGRIGEIKQGEIFRFESPTQTRDYVFVAEGYAYLEKTIDFNTNDTLEIRIPSQIESLNEVVLSAKRKEVFALKRMQDFDKTAIYAGKKTEVVLVDQSMANLAANNARQIFNQVPGLNIYQNDDAGIQLHIGGRGLDPNRTSNFNTRQNGYDISADVLGYPESYYTPPAEAIEEIQIIRGAASLQYGTQFGGLINFKLKDATGYQPFTAVIRNTVGSNNLYTNYTQVSGRLNKWRYFGYFNGKKGSGFRPNSAFNSLNSFFKLRYDFSEKSMLSAEVTYMDYLAQQAGGLTDQMFLTNPYQSNRERNWFGLHWFMYNLNFEHSFSEQSQFSFNFFGLNAQRKAIGYRSNRVDEIDSFGARDLIRGDFANFGFETRWLYNYNLGAKKAVWLIGSKFYKANNSSEQGAGSEASDADFDSYRERFPNYNKQSDYIYPNENLAFFTEHILYLNDQLSITPGIRYEYIRTASKGTFQKINTDAAGNVILNLTEESDEARQRNFVLFGLGLSYRLSSGLELYGNVSQNYRSVTFSDISIINPSFIINPEISDEKGYTADIGLRGKVDNLLSFDTNFFHLAYLDRIGFIPKVDQYNRVKSERGNVGNAALYGLESLIDLNIGEWLKLDPQKIALSSFVNFAYINSEYTSSIATGVMGKSVEFVPKTNLKTGIRFGYKNLMLNIQFSSISEQFTDATNAVAGSVSGVIGRIPSYELLDFSGSYTLNRFKFEFGINNLLDQAYYTRRATGYPGPGIIPSPNRNLYLTTQIKL